MVACHKYGTAFHPMVSFTNFSTFRRKHLNLRMASSGLATGLAAVLLCSAMAPVSALTETRPSLVLEAKPVQTAGGDLYTFYANRHLQPLWFDGQAQISPAAISLISLFDSAQLDGISGSQLQTSSVKAAVDQALVSKAPGDITKAELALSRTFIDYVQALRSNADRSMIYEHDQLKPRQVNAFFLLNEAAKATSPQAYISDMKWMHPLYASVRRSVTSQSLVGAARQSALANLARLRSIPNNKPKHVLVDVASARLWMYEGDRVVDSMRVVVGKSTSPTPLMAGYIRYAIQNPYWNVPPEMVGRNIASNVLSRGVPYLKTAGYEVLSDWGKNPSVVDPQSVDWKAVASGKVDLRVRQLPGPRNSMGKVKYEFPNPQGIYLHDTPQKELMQKTARQLSGGCIRLEDADRLGRWLMGGAMPANVSGPEVRKDLPVPIPIFITYMTVDPQQTSNLALVDPYKLDAPRS